MARPLRIAYPGALYHLTTRGNSKAPIFIDPGDQWAFLSLLDDVVFRCNWICHGYCLMGNHYHLLIETPDGNLSDGMRYLNSNYTQKFNRRHNHVGHVLQGRFKSVVVDKQGYLLELCRYIVLNPVRAGIVKKPGHYTWSSYRATAGLSRSPDFLFTDWILAQFGKQLEAARKAYRKFVLSGIRNDSPWKKLKGQWLLGDDSFMEQLSPLLKSKTALKEIPRAQRYAIRPPLAILLSGVKTRVERNAAISKAHLGYGYSQKEIAVYIGLHYATVSKIIARERKTSKCKI